jgi:predicted nucleotidyltransferase
VVKKSVLNIVSRFRKALKTKGIKVERMVLFGSCARGAQKEGSDIDVVVISEDFADKGYWDRIEILSDAIFTVFEPIEAIAMTPQEWDKGESSIVEYARDGEVVYG